jgi:hypothetical protein
LSKADRLFTGTVEGRVIEVLQNARRAGAKEVRITNREGFVTVEDDGSGIEDFQKLLDLGASGWDEGLEAAEDPAGVGLFSLAPREVTVISGSRQIIIDKDGWTGKPVEITNSSSRVKGTTIRFRDEKPWDLKLVEAHAVFTGLKVVVDSRYCHSMPFCSGEATRYDDPGCRLEVTKNVSKYHKNRTTTWYHGRVLVNFHGQVVQLDHWPGRDRYELTILVDIADRTDIRLMLPARTMLVENPAFERLKAAIELEYYRYWQRQKTHGLYYEEYLRARELGIELPEAEPSFEAGLIWSDYGEPVEVVMPANLRLEDCYLCPAGDFEDDAHEINAHLLAALGEHEGKPFVPVHINNGYMGYSWTKLPKVTKVEVSKGTELLRRSIIYGEIACFDRLSITVHTSDDRTFASEVDMAVVTETPRNARQWPYQLVCVTKKAARTLSGANIWFHFGGYDEEGDSYDTQLYYFEEQLQGFWNELAGPYETLRRQLTGQLYQLDDKWQKVTVFEDDSIEIFFKDGRKERVRPPAESV